MQKVLKVFKNILARQESIAPVNLLISLNKLYILLQCFNCRFQLVNIWCIIWSISRPTSSHLTFLVIVQIGCLYLGDVREKYVWCSTILWVSTKFTCNKIIAWTHCSSHFSSQFHWSNMLILSMLKCTPYRNVLDL